MLIGEGWTAYLGMLTQIVSVAALLGTGVAVSWSFGREFTDATLSGLFALPTSASTSRRRASRRTESRSSPADYRLPRASSRCGGCPIGTACARCGYRPTGRLGSLEA